MFLSASSFAQSLDAVFLNSTIKIFEKAKTINEVEQAGKKLSLKASSPEKEALKIVQKVFAAAAYSNNYDSFNNKSTALYLQAVENVESIRNIPLQIWVFTQTGFYFYSYNQYEKALPYFLKSSRLIDDISAEKLVDAVEILKKNAYFFGTILEHEKGITYLQKALKLIPSDSKNQGVLLNGIGNCYTDMIQLDKAEFYQLKAKKSALQNKDDIRYAKVLGDLARIEIIRKNWDKAEKLLLEDIVLSEQTKNDRNTMFARLQLGKMYWKKGDTEKALVTLNQVQQYAGSKNYLKGFEHETAEVLLQIAIHQRENVKELALRRKLDTLEITVKNTEGKEVISKIGIQTQKEKIVLQLEAEKIKSEKESLLRTTWTIVSIVLFFVIVLIYMYDKRRLKLQAAEFDRNLLFFQYEKIQSEKKLSDAHNSLESYKIYLSEKNQQIENLEEVIGVSKKHTAHLDKEQTSVLQQLLLSHLMTDENWKNFKDAFIEEQSQYYLTLLDCLPGLTESNLRILLLHKVGLNNQEFAQIAGVTIEAVKKAKQRLRKKYDKVVEIFL